MANIRKVTELLQCTGCGACDVCAHISFETNELGFPAPVVDDACEDCGRCLAACPFDPDLEDDA